MIRPENGRSWVPRTAELTLAAGLAATYIITTFIPLTPFIGGPGFITLEIVMLPIIASLPAAFRLKNNPRIGLLTFYIAMTEQVTLNILSISILSLTGPVWSVITPLMYVERAIATLGGAAGIVALKSGLGGRLDLMDQSPREVRQ